MEVVSSYQVWKEEVVIVPREEVKPVQMHIFEGVPRETLGVLAIWQKEEAYH
jgi:hypothetical protein